MLNQHAYVKFYSSLGNEWFTRRVVRVIALNFSGKAIDNLPCRQLLKKRINYSTVHHTNRREASFASKRREYWNNIQSYFIC